MAVVAAVLAVVLSACQSGGTSGAQNSDGQNSDSQTSDSQGSDGASSDGAATTPAPETLGATPAPVHEALNYVALGDSFSAGPLIPQARSDATSCFVSTNNYPAYLATMLEVATYADVTCSGATSADFRRPQPVASEPQPKPQYDALSAETDLVTVGIGGNDYALFASVLACSDGGIPCGPREFAAALDIADRVSNSVARGLRGVHQRAPEAEVYLVGYPRLLPQRGTCADIGFTPAQARAGRQIELRLNNALRTAARRTDTTFVNLRGISRGHDICAGSDAWVNGNADKPGEAMAWHPFQVEMEAAARAIYAKITDQEAPVSTFAATPNPDSIVPRD